MSLSLDKFIDNTNSKSYNYNYCLFKFFDINR